jgi:hypothetical protein
MRLSAEVKKILMFSWALAMAVVLLQASLTLLDATTHETQARESSIMYSLISMVLGFPIGSVVTMLINSQISVYDLFGSFSPRSAHFFEFVVVWIVNLMGGFFWWLILLPRLINARRRRD